MNWTDIHDIVELLVKLHKHEDPKKINFVRLHELIYNLPDFTGEKHHSNERILESIQMAWIDEIS